MDALDGLRTVAVFLVVLFHVSAPRMSAGYLGVDVFFVLSGFLITSGLLREATDNGRINLLHFFHRRMKRLLPASLLVIISVLVWTRFFAPAFRTATIATDAWYTIFYLANWRLIRSSSYFESDGTTSPLLHMWSLAVEEQFYLGWPLLLAGLVFLLRKHLTSPIRVRVLFGVLAFTLATASMILLATFYEVSAPDRSYMGTDTKIFEPLLGALLAVMVTQSAVRAWFVRHARTVLWIGGLVMVALFAILDGPSPVYFYGGAAIFSLGVVLVIGAVSNAPHLIEARLLSWAPISYLGRISYGLYLWHWPIALGFDVYAGEFRPVRAGAVVGLTVVLAALSYHLVEMPIRRGAIGRMLPPRRTIVAGILAMTITAIGAGLAGGTPLTRALALSRGPASANPEHILVLGYSVPARLMPSLAKVGEQRGLTVVSAAQGSCTPLGVELDFGPDNRSGEKCPEVLDEQARMLAEYEPGLIIWWSRYEVADRVIGGEVVSPDDDRFWIAQEADLLSAIDRLTTGGGVLVFVLTERPGLGMLDRDERALKQPLIERLIYRDDLRVRYNSMVGQLASQDPRVFTVNGDEFFCSPEPGPGPGGLCNDSTEGGGYIRYDGSHVALERFGTEIATTLLDESFASATGG